KLRTEALAIGSESLAAAKPGVARARKCPHARHFSGPDRPWLFVGAPAPPHHPSWRSPVRPLGPPPLDQRRGDADLAHRGRNISARLPGSPKGPQSGIPHAGVLRISSDRSGFVYTAGYGAYSAGQKGFYFDSVQFRIADCGLRICIRQSEI